LPPRNSNATGTSAFPQREPISGQLLVDSSVVSIGLLLDATLARAKCLCGEVGGAFALIEWALDGHTKSNLWRPNHAVLMVGIVPTSTGRFRVPNSPG
jgi:hypothetical protein